MTRMDRVVRNGRVYFDGRLQNVDLWIRDGKVASLGGTHQAEETIDGRGMIVLPGAVDLHVHFRDPGYTHKEDWETGSTSAVAGGVTTVVDQPNTDPPPLDEGSYRINLDIAERRSAGDSCPNGGPGAGEGWVRAFGGRVGPPPRSGFGMTAAAVPGVAAEGLGASSMRGNPVELTQEELEAILLAAL